MKNWGIQTRILALALAPAIAVAGALSVYFLLALLSDLDRDLRDRGMGLARQLAAIAEYSTYSGDRQTLHGVALAALEEAHVSSVEVYDHEGEALAASGALPAPLSTLPSAQQASLLQEDEEHLRIAAPVLRHRLEIQDPFLSDITAPAQSPSPPLLGWIVVEMSRQSLEQRRQETIAFTLTLVLLTVAATSLLAMVLARQVSRPIIRMERAMERIRAGQLDLQLPADSGGDLQRLEEGFNTMALALHEARDNLESKISEATQELELKRAEAEQSSHAKSRFLAAASHDLRQPLHALNLFTADLKSQTNTPEQARLVNQITTSIHSMSELLEALVNISRLDVAGIHPRNVPTPLQRVFDQLQQAYRQEAEQRGLNLRFHPTRAWATTDPILLERLLSNLIANALRYTTHGSVLIAARQRGPCWRIEVRDSGCGIAPEHQHAIFEEFFQIGNKERQQGQGLGLGLAIVARLAKAMEAPLELRSAPEKGSLFALMVSSCPPAPEALAPTPSTTARPIAAILAYGPELINDTVPQLQGWLTDWGFEPRTIQSQDEASALSHPDQRNTVIWLAPGNEEALKGVLTTKQDHKGILITKAAPPAPAPPTAYFTLAYPARPAKLRALLQRLAAEVSKQTTP